MATNFSALEDGRLGLEFQSIAHEAASFEKGDQRLAAEALGVWGAKLFANLAKYEKARAQFLPDAYLFHGDLKNEQQIDGRLSAIREFSAEGQSITSWLKSEDYRIDMEQSQVASASIEKVAAKFRETLQPKWDLFTACTQKELAVASNAAAILELSKQHLGHWTAKPDDHDPTFEDPVVERTFQDLRDSEIDLEDAMYASESKLAVGDRFRDPALRRAAGKMIKRPRQHHNRACPHPRPTSEPTVGSFPRWDERTWSMTQGGTFFISPRAPMCSVTLRFQCLSFSFCLRGLFVRH